jgi:hypothetical protein
MNQLDNLPFACGGNCLAASFGKIDPSVPFTVIQAGAGDETICIFQDGSKAPPGLVAYYGGTETALCGGVGDKPKMYFAGDRCLLRAGTGGWTAGADLMSDANGNGVAATGTNYIGAQALSTVNAGELGDVIVVKSTKRS